MPLTPTREERSAVRPGAVLLVVSSAAFLASLDLFVVAIAFPAIRADFPGSDLASMSWVLNGYTVVFAAFLALAGRLGDRYGHRRVFRAGLVVFTLASAVCAASPSVGALVAARAVQALGAALVTPASLALLLAAYPAAKRARTVGIWASIGAVAAALGPPVGGLLADLSWHWVFLVNLPVGLVALAASARVLPRTHPDVTGRPDVAGAVALVAAVGALAWALVRAADAGWADPWVAVGLAVAVLGLAAVVLRSARHRVPALDLAVLRSPRLSLAAVAMLLFTTGFSAMLLVNVLFLTGTWGWSAWTAGLALAPGPLVVVVVARFSGGWSARWGAGRVAAVGGLAFALGPAWWWAAMTAVPAYATAMLPGQLMTGLGVGLILPSLSTVVGSALPATRWGAGSSLVNTARQIGAVLGTALSVTVVGAATTGRPDELPLLRHGWIMLVVCGLAAATAAGALAVAERRATTGGS